MILVVGSTGLLGREVCQQLSVAGRAARALVRPSTGPDRLESLRAPNLEFVSGELQDPASLESACVGVDTVICTASSMPFAYRAAVNDIQSVDRDGVIRLVDIARAAGVRHFIYTSFSGNLEIACPLRDAKRDVERHLRSSGMHFTILRPSYFMEVWFSPLVGFDPSAHRAVIYGAGDRRISWISLKDVARFAVLAADHPAARNTTLELGGPEPLTPLEVVSIFETTLRHRFAVSYVLDSALHARHAAATDPMDKSIAALMIGVVHGDWIPMHDVLQQFPLKLTRVRTFAAGLVPQTVTA